MQKIGVLLLNMGGPTDIYGVENFLKNIFNDPVILPIKNPLIRKIVSSAIVSKRLEYVKKIYRAIGGGSPIIKHTFSLTQKLNTLDSQRTYSYSMRYSPPFAKDALQEFKDNNINDIVLFSMYPQSSFTTIHSSLNEVHQNLKELEYKPRVRVIEHYYDHEPFYHLITDEIERVLNGEDARDFILILSAHGLPKNVVDKGDTYPQQCQRGLEIISEICKQRGMAFDEIKLSYQSKVGPMKWIKPATSDVIAESKHKKIIIYPIAFSVDNSETDYELRIEYAKLAKSLNVKDYRVCLCMNDSEAFAQMIIDLIAQKCP